jgi:serine/threonine protein kinase
MPAPVTADELLALVQRSGVADEAKLRAYTQKLTQSGNMPSDPAKLAGVLVRDGVLTYFQAEQLLQGKYKRFTIGKYKVLEKLGAGGMAQVFLCEHKLMRRRVAIKVLPTAKADDPSSLERFYREARAVAAVDHPNIVRAYDIDQDENLHFLVMEYVDGTNLQDLVKKFGQLDIIRACHYIYGASVGLQHAHEIGLVHRDIKPGNILVDRAGVVKVLDMGLARFFNDEEDVLTKKYDENVLGTADYLAPEQALESHTVDIRADIYALGATFYFLLSGNPLFPEGSVAQKLIWHQTRQPKSLRSLRPEVPAEIVAIIDKMMAKDREKRYQTPAEVLGALAPWVATPIPPPAERELPQISLAAGGVGGRGPTTMLGATAPVVTTLGSPGARTAVTPAVGVAPVAVSRSANTQHDAATLPSASPPAHTPAPITPTPPPLPGQTSSGHPAVWESLDDETQSVSDSDTDRSTPRSTPRTPAPRRSTMVPQAGKSRTSLLLYAALGILTLAGVGAIVYFGFLNKNTTPDPNPQPPPAHTGKITVSKTPGENTFGTLREAVAHAQAGDTIVITEPKLSEPYLSLKGAKYRDITIESVTPDGKPAVIETSGSGRAMLDATDVEGVHLKNVEFDCKGQVDVGVMVGGSCPGLTIENVTIRGSKVAGIRTSNAAGAEGRPVVLDHIRVLVSPNQTGILMFSIGVDTRRLAIKNSRFEGVGNGTGIRIDGASADVDITGNRFFNLDTALAFNRPPTNKTVKAQITNNTVYQAKVGLLFDLPAPVPGESQMGSFGLTINENYFAKTAMLGKFTDQGPGGSVTSVNNGYFESNGGNVVITAVLLESPQLPAPDPNNDATFLRFPLGQPDFGGKKIGAP